MKVILLDDVQDVGHEGDIVEVADGYARNYLLPQGLATAVTAGARKELEQRSRAINERQQTKTAEAEQLAGILREKPILVEASVGEGGRLHGEVTPRQIVEAINEQFDVTLDRRGIDIPVPIRETGDYLISATLYQGVTAELPVHVIEQGTRETYESAAAEQLEQNSEPAGADETDEEEEQGE